MPGSFAVGARDVRCDLLGPSDVGEREYRTAEASAEQSCAVRPRLFGERDEQVELGDGDFVVVTETRVTLEEQATRGGEVATFESGREVTNPVVLGLHVTDPTRHSVFELLPPPRVARRLVAVRHGGVDDDERRSGRERNKPVLESAAIEQDRLALPTEQSCCLVEDAARHSDRTQFGALACERECVRVELEARNRAEREPDRNLECSRRCETRAGRQIRTDGSDQAGRRSTQKVELRGDGLRVARPAGRGSATPIGEEWRRNSEDRSETSETLPSAAAASSEIP